MSENTDNDYKPTPVPDASRASSVPGDKAELGELKEAAGKAALATVLAGSITAGAAAITPDSVVLPEATPIVQTFDSGAGSDLPDSATDEHQATKSSVWKKILQVLKYIIVALALIAGVVFGLLQGCASCAGQLAAPPAALDEESEKEVSHAVLFL